MLRRLKKVAAASNVMAVCLWIGQSPAILASARKSLLCHFVGLERSHRTLHGLVGKLLHIGLAGQIVMNGIVRGLFSLDLFQFVHQGHGEIQAFIVGVVELVGEDSVDDIVVA